MKILKVKIKRQHDFSGTHYTYPPEYDSQKIQVLGYESEGEYNNVISRGDEDEYCIGVVKDKDAPQFLASSDIEEIDRTTACEMGRKWRPQVEKIVNQDRVIGILAKIGRGEELAIEEKNALNPDNPETGINKSKLFDDTLDEYLKGSN